MPVDPEPLGAVLSEPTDPELWPCPPLSADPALDPVPPGLALPELLVPD